MTASIRRASLALAATVAAVGLLAAPSGAGMTYGTNLYMSKKFPAFHGKIHSANNFCVADRKVRVYRERPGKDKLLGVDRSEDHGKWSVKVILISGVYYARAPLYGSASLGITCRADRSRIAVVD